MEALVRELPIWQGQVKIETLSGGMTNRNYLVTDEKRRAVVRIGEDIPEHQVVRSNDLAASLAAHAAGVSPEVLHHAPGILVLDYIEGKTLEPEDFSKPDTLEKAVKLVRESHQKMPSLFQGPAMIFWTFQVVRHYERVLHESNSPYKDILPDLMKPVPELEKAAGPFDIVFGHNDLLAANFIDDGKRLWLIDWEFAGFNTPLFDLGGMASNNEFSEGQEKTVLELYFGAIPSSDLWRRYRALKCGALLREVMWSMVSESHSDLDYDYHSYTTEHMKVYKDAIKDFFSA
ncbi:MAG: phosphotransferase family protein [Proteobacteria bacterium]|nr:phosphotransferase family protein [Pseudomonadota bacterium]